MELFLATKTGTPIIGQIASVMGWIMDGIYKMLDGLFGIQNIGLCIIIFSILIFAFMTPLQIKQALVGYGRADKKQIQQMVKIMLNLKQVPKPDDTADALAMTICHAQTSGSLLRNIKASNI